MLELIQNVEQNGFAVVPSCIDESTVQRLRDLIGETRHAQRNLLALSEVRDLAASQPVREIIGTILGSKCFAVRGIFFNKTRISNWKVVWHQDLTIAVRKRQDVQGFGPWTLKAGVLHVQPHAEIMERMLAIRIHLDDSALDNGPLQIIPGSHKTGRLSTEQIETWQRTGCVTCTVPSGGALVMRPLLLHASSACVVSKPRRVIHLEFSAEELPQGLEWHDRV
jgi:ectoine hydroxylase-related dioxygenase (phytanoyl-CoA dioxygenase family)